MDYEDEKNVSSLFARWKWRQLKREKAEGGVPARVWYAVLVQAVRVEGKPRQKVVGYLDSIRESWIGKSAERVNFWLNVERKLKEVEVEETKYEKIINALSKKVPLPTEMELRDFMLSYQKT